MSSSADPQAARLTIDYPDRDLDRVSTALRLVYAIPVMIVLGVVAGGVAGDTAGAGWSPIWSPSAGPCRGLPGSAPAAVSA
jgi:hypothetical protein